MTISTSHIPNKPGVYIFKDSKDSILYIGKAKDLKKRVDQYFSPGSVWKQDMLNKADKVEFIVVGTESEALYLEDNLIKKHLPEYNRLLKADNSYVYIKISKEDFPQIRITRERKNDGSTYIGPKHGTRALKKLLQYLRQIYKFRTSNKGQFNKGELTSDYYFGLDEGRSVISKLNSKDSKKYINKAQQSGFIPNKTYEEYKDEYKIIIQQIKKFFNGNTKAITKDIKLKIQDNIKKENFEYAATLRDIYFHLETITEKQSVVLDTRLSGKITLITTINQHHILVMIHFFEGKMIDIVREKYSSDDRSYNQLVTACENDFGTMKIYSFSKKNLIEVLERSILEENNIHTFLLVSESMKKLKKLERSSIHDLMEKFIDSYLASDSFRENSLLNELLQNLQQKYNLTHFPYRIECVDISHLSGGRISGGLSAFVGGIPFKKGYRRYKIQSIKESEGYSNDYKALKEIIIRRFITTTNKGNLPELFILDGGKGQLGILKEILQKYPELESVMQHTQFVALGKGKARERKGRTEGAKEILYSLDKDLNILEQKLNYDQTDKILIKIRDESHRFANKYRKKRMSMERK